MKTSKYFLLYFVIAIAFINTLNSESFRDAPVPIFYGYNESHGYDWVQNNSEGLVGASYFVPFDSGNRNTNQRTEGYLIYKTIDEDGFSNEEFVVSGFNMEVSVLLYDLDSNPHIFVASSDTLEQVIYHYYKNSSFEWSNEIIIDLENDNGSFIYELSADIHMDGSYHFSVLMTRSNPDSDDYFFAFQDSKLYYVTNMSGTWSKQHISTFDCVYTLDEYTKMSKRQDIEIDSYGNAHIVYGEQIDPFSGFSPSRLNYTNNSQGNWSFEVAVNYNANTRDDAGWYPSLCLDSVNRPFISCCYVSRVGSGSAYSADLILASRFGPYQWNIETVCQNDDGYYGYDGRTYTGALTHLIIDTNDVPYILFSDIASSHGRSNYFNLGNIRLAVKNENEWDINTFYRQPLPVARYEATEMYGMGLLINEDSGNIQVLGQEIEVFDESNYEVRLVHEVISSGNVSVDNLSPSFLKTQIYPNPFIIGDSTRKPTTNIEFTLKNSENVNISVFNLLGQKITTIVNKKLEIGKQSVQWDGRDESGDFLQSGIYLYRLKTDSQSAVGKMILFRN